MNACTFSHRWGKWSEAKVVKLYCQYAAPTWTGTSFEEEVWYQERTCHRCGVTVHRKEKL